MTAPARQKRPDLVDVRELRQVAARFEVRTDEARGTLALTGYASTFEPYDVYGGPAVGGWIEQLATSAFDKTLRENPDLHLLINHTGMPLARTKSGTLMLAVDRHGLKVEAPALDLEDPDVQRLRVKMKRGDMDEMSFAFRVKAQAWSATDDFPDDSYALRTITEVSLHKGDVSVVNFGANPTTTAEIASRRRKTEDGRKMTLTRAEAEALVLADRKWMARHRVGGHGTAALVRAAEAEDAAWAAQEARSDAVVARAQEILRSYGYPESTQRHVPQERYAGLRRDPDFVVGLPTLLSRLAEKEQRQAREARAAELIRQADEILHPPRPKRESSVMQWKFDRGDRKG